MEEVRLNCLRGLTGHLLRGDEPSRAGPATSWCGRLRHVRYMRLYSLYRPIREEIKPSGPLLGVHRDRHRDRVAIRTGGAPHYDMHAGPQLAHRHDRQPEDLGVPGDRDDHAAVSHLQIERASFHASHVL